MTDQRSERYFRLRWFLLHGDDRGFDQWWSRLADKQSRRTRADEIEAEFGDMVVPA